MNTTLSAEDKKDMALYAENDPVVIYLKNRDSQRFEVGDILNKLLINYEDKWEVETVSYKTKSPKKYVFMGEDQYGVGYVKALKADGKEFIKGLFCLASFNSDNIRFQVDPEFATATLLGSDGYDHNAEYKLIKDRRKKAREDNRKIVLLDKDLETYLFSTLKVGDKFWIASDLSGHGREEWTIVKQHKKKKDEDGRYISIDHAGRYTDDRNILYFYHPVFTSKPVSVEDLI